MTEAANTIHTEFVVRDPRNGQSVSTSNPALIAHELLRIRANGVELDSNSFIDAADRCHVEGVTVKGFTLTGLPVEEEVVALLAGSPVTVKLDGTVWSAKYKKERKKLDS